MHLPLTCPKLFTLVMRMWLLLTLIAVRQSEAIHPLPGLCLAGLHLCYHSGGHLRYILQVNVALAHCGQMHHFL